MALIDQSGAVVWQAEFDAWGNLRREYDPQDLGQTIRMQEQHYDRETGLFYNRYRYYMPRLGRYVTRDPIGLKGGLNGFEYAAGTPLHASDPLGLWASQLGAYVHQHAGHLVFGNESNQVDLSTIARGQEWADSAHNQTAERAFMHAMRNGDSGETVAQVCAKSNAFIEKVAAQAFDEKAKGN